MERFEKTLASIGCVFLFAYIMFGIVDPVELFTVAAGSLKASAALLDFVKQIWTVFAEGGVVGFIVWVFSGFKTVIHFASIGDVWQVLVSIFKDNFFADIPW